MASAGQSKVITRSKYPASKPPLKSAIKGRSGSSAAAPKVLKVGAAAPPATENEKLKQQSDANLRRKIAREEAMRKYADEMANDSDPDLRAAGEAALLAANGTSTGTLTSSDGRPIPTPTGRVSELVQQFGGTPRGCAAHGILNCADCAATGAPAPRAPTAFGAEDGAVPGHQPPFRQQFVAPGFRRRRRTTTLPIVRVRSFGLLGFLGRNSWFRRRCRRGRL